MGRRPHRTFRWLPGLLSLAGALLFAAGPWAFFPEAKLLAFASGFAAPLVESPSVVVIDVGDVAPADRTKLLKRLSGAKAVGVVPPLPLAVTELEAPVVYAQRFLERSGRSALPLPEAVANWPMADVASPLPAGLPGLLTGHPPALAWLDPEPLPAGSLAAPADFPADAGRVPLTRRHQGALLSGFALRLTAAALGAELNGEVLRPSAIALDYVEIDTDAAYRVYPRLAEVDVAQHGAADLLAGRVKVKDRIVLLGTLTPEAAEPVVLPDGQRVPPLLAEARLVAALLDGSVWAVPPWSVWVHLGAFALAGMLLMFALPRLSVASGAILLALWAVVIGTTAFGLLVLKGIYTPLMVPGLAVLVGAPLLWLKGRGDARLGALRADLNATNRLLAEAYHAQGQLDAAFNRYRRCGPAGDALERLYELGMDFERRRQFGKAGAVFAHIAAASPGFREVEERLKRNREADQRMVFGKGGSTTASGTLILDSAGLARPTLGRYELERELGRGAMGLVYLGRDPRIGRTVAIKTMALSQEFEGPDLATARERFFREAETAGRLDHPHIVTIYDVGEEQDLSYIAMDYLKGESLAHWCRRDSLLPFDEVMAIGIQVAEALDYAHEQGVIHRDIKPANIIYDRNEGVAKVTDFGVACVTDSSKTRTGTVLGSPSYMSPEQVAGHRLDGRSDLFSLGVTLFQLLSGELPFKADSLPSLMYLIANERHTDIRNFRDFPPCLSRLINKALHKEIARRYQTGRTMAEALRRCRREAVEEAA